MTALDGSKPRNMVATTAKSDFVEGALVDNGGSNTIELISAVTDKPLGVLDQATVDEEGTARATRTSEQVGVHLVGSGAVVNVICMTGATLTVGCAVYVSQTADTDGYCDDDNSNSAVKIGHYVGAGETTSGATLIPVLLDVVNAN